MKGRSQLGGDAGILAAVQHAALIALSRLKIRARVDPSCQLEAAARVGLVELDVDAEDLRRAVSDETAAAMTKEVHGLIPNFGRRLDREIGPDWTVRPRRRRHRLVVETPLPQVLAATIPLRAMRACGLAVELGQRLDGGRAVLDLATAPHVFIGGASSCGKTTLARGILSTLARFNDPAALQVVILDPKARLAGGGALSRLPHLAFAPARAPEDLAAGLAWLAAQVDDRAARSPAEVESLPRVVVFVDEAWAALAAGGAHGIVRRAREYGVHFVVVSQAATARDLDPGLAGQLVERITGRVAPGDWRAARSNAGDSVALSLAGRGDMYSPSLGRFQAAWAELDDGPPPAASSLIAPAPAVNVAQPGAMPAPIRSWLLLSARPDGQGQVKLPGRSAIVERVKALTGTGIHSGRAADWQRAIAAELAPGLEVMP